MLWDQREGSGTVLLVKKTVQSENFDGDALNSLPSVRATTPASGHFVRRVVTQPKRQIGMLGGLEIIFGLQRTNQNH